MIETRQPYRESSFGIDGQAPLEALAPGCRLAGGDAFSATWTGPIIQSVGVKQGQPAWSWSGSD